jgi:hypothetical protein
MPLPAYKEIPIGDANRQCPGAEKWFRLPANVTALYSMNGRKQFPSASERLSRTNRGDQTLPLIGTSLDEGNYDPLTLHLARKPIIAFEVWRGASHLRKVSVSATYSIDETVARLIERGLLESTENILFLLRVSPKTIFVSDRQGFQTTPAGKQSLRDMRIAYRRSEGRSGSMNGLHPVSREIRLQS